MDLPDKGKACPIIKLVYIEAAGELRRVGPRYMLKHYYSTYGKNTIKVTGYSVRGNKQLIAIDVIIEFDVDDESSLHDAFLVKLGYNV